MGIRDLHLPGDYSRILGAAIKERGVQTEKYLLEEEVTKADKGILARRGRRHNEAPTLSMNNQSQTEVHRHKYSVFVVAFLLVMALNIWFAYVTFNIHYKVFSPSLEKVKPSGFEWLRYFRSTYIFKKLFVKTKM